MRDLLSSKDIAFVQIDDEIKNEEEAKQILISSGAWLIIWGSYGRDYIAIHYTFNFKLGVELTAILKTRYIKSSPSVNLDRGWVDAETFTTYISNRGDTEYHIQLLLAILELQNENFAAAVELLDKCEALFPFETLSTKDADQALSGLISL